LNSSFFSITEDLDCYSPLVSSTTSDSFNSDSTVGYTSSFYTIFCSLADKSTWGGPSPSGYSEKSKFFFPFANGLSSLGSDLNSFCITSIGPLSYSSSPSILTLQTVWLSSFFSFNSFNWMDVSFEALVGASLNSLLGMICLFICVFEIIKKKQTVQKY